MATTYVNIRMHKKSGNDDIIMYPQTLDTNILIDTSNTSIPSSVASVNDLVESMGGLAFEDNVAVNVDTETEYAVLRTTDSPNTDDSDLIATAKAVATVDASAVKLETVQEVDSMKAFNEGINIGGTVAEGSVTGGADITFEEGTGGALDRVVFS